MLRLAACTVVSDATCDVASARMRSVARARKLPVLNTTKLAVLSARTCAVPNAFAVAVTNDDTCKLVRAEIWSVTIAVSCAAFSELICEELRTLKSSV